MSTELDLPFIDNIYNQAIKQGLLTAHMKPMSNGERTNWYRQHSHDNYPVYVFDKNNKVLGWAALSPYRPGREALNEVAVLSFYVDFDYHKQGIGTKLVEYCLNNAPLLNKRIFFSIIIEGNKDSIGLLKKFGFKKWGYFPEVINYKETKRGQVYMGKVLV